MANELVRIGQYPVAPPLVRIAPYAVAPLATRYSTIANPSPASHDTGLTAVHRVCEPSKFFS